MIVLDTNVLSELMKPVPAARVLKWIAARPAADFCTTSITRAEILYGLMLLPAGRRRRTLEGAVASMFAEDFEGRILSFDSEAALPYAQIASDRRHAGRPISHLDAQIAAIARFTGATLATRNASDFDGCGVTVVDPWSA